MENVRTLSSRPKIVLTPAIRDTIIAHARTEQPNECCGVLAGKHIHESYHVDLCIRMVNALSSPTRFAAEPRSLLAAHKRIRSEGRDVLAFYHSHPTTAAIPSRLDREQHYWGPTVACVIVGSDEMVRAWWMTESECHEAIIEVSERNG